MLYYKALTAARQGPCQHSEWPTPGTWATADGPARYGRRGLHVLPGARALLWFVSNYGAAERVWRVEVRGPGASDPRGASPGLAFAHARLLEPVERWRDGPLRAFAGDVARRLGVEPAPGPVPERLRPAVTPGPSPARPRPIRWVDPERVRSDLALLAAAAAPGDQVIGATLRAASALLGGPVSGHRMPGAIDYERKAGLPLWTLDTPAGKRIVALAEAKITAPADARLPRTPLVRSGSRAAPGTRGGQARSGSW